MHSVPDLCVCSIVRDEMENPAGGIEDFVRSVMPHVEAGVIVDTGSRDGTREALEQLSGEFPNLYVYDRLFDTFANSRNYALKKAKKLVRWAYLLDADHRVGDDVYAQIPDITPIGCVGFYFRILNLIPDHKPVRKRSYFPLLVQTGRVHFEGPVYEEMYYGNVPIADVPCATLDSELTVSHYCPSVEGFRLKKEQLYAHIKDAAENGQLPKAPSELPGYRTWKSGLR